MAKKKISKRKIFKIVSAASLLLIMMWASARFHETKCDVIEINIENSGRDSVRFLENNDVMELIYSDVQKIQGYNMDSVNIYNLESKLRKCPYIRNVSIYKTISGKLKIDVVQRTPLLMVIANKGKPYYIDGDGIVFETSEKYSPPVAVANGFINDGFEFPDGMVYRIDLKDSLAGKTVAADLFRLIKLIEADDFWRDQIEQIFVNKLGEYELVPMVGKYILSLGSIEDYDKKMYILKEFYFKGLRKTGWNKYKQISVKYKNQIVCKK